MPTDADEDYIHEHLYMFDRIQLPGGMWTRADLLHRSGELCYQAIDDRTPHPLPVGSHLQAPGLGVVKYVRSRR